MVTATLTATFVVLAALAAVWILCIVFLSPWVGGWIATKLLNAFLMPDNCFIRVGSVHVSALMATVVFERVVYATPNSVTTIVDGYVKIRWWLPNALVRHNLTDPPRHLSRLLLYVNGVEFHVINNSDRFNAFERLVVSRAAARGARDSPKKEPLTASNVDVDAALPLPQDFVLPVYYRLSRVIQIVVQRGCIVFEKPYVPNFAVFSFRKAAGQHGVSDATHPDRDYYKHVTELNFYHVEAHLFPNPRYRGPRDHHADPDTEALPHVSTSSNDSFAFTCWSTLAEAESHIGGAEAGPYRSYVHRFRCGNGEQHLVRCPQVNLTYYSDEAGPVTSHQFQRWQRQWKHGDQVVDEDDEDASFASAPSQEEVLRKGEASDERGKGMVEDDEEAEEEEGIPMGNMPPPAAAADEGGDDDDESIGVRWNTPAWEHLMQGLPQFGLDLVWFSPIMNYGPWANEARAVLQEAFLPSEYRTGRRERVQLPAQGQPRLFGLFRVGMSMKPQLEAETRSVCIRVPFPNVQDPQAGHWMQLEAEEGTVDFVMPWMEPAGGSSVTMDVHVKDVVVTTSVNDSKLLRARHMMLHGDLWYPEVWNDVNQWTFDFDLRGAKLWFLYAHVDLFSHLATAWGAGGRVVPQEDGQGALRYATPESVPLTEFIPTVYRVNVQLRDGVEVMLNANQYNIVDEPNLGQVNTEFCIFGDALDVSVNIPFTEFEAQVTEIDATVNAKTALGVSLCMPATSTVGQQLPTNPSPFLHLDAFHLHAAYSWYAEVAPHHLDTLSLRVRGHDLRVTLYPFYLSYLLNVKANYLGWCRQCVTTSEFKAANAIHFNKGFQRAVSRPVDWNDFPFGVPEVPEPQNAFEAHVILETVGSVELDIPIDLYSMNRSVTVVVDTIGLEVRVHPDFINVDVQLGAAEVLVPLIQREVELGEQHVHHVANLVRLADHHVLQVSHFGFQFHFMYGPPPVCMNYKEDYRVRCGEITGQLAPSQLMNLIMLGQNFVHHLSSDDNSLCIPSLTEGVAETLTYSRIQLTVQVVRLMIVTQTSVVQLCVDVPPQAQPLHGLREGGRGLMCVYATPTEPSAVSVIVDKLITKHAHDVVSVHVPQILIRQYVPKALSADEASWAAASGAIPSVDEAHLWTEMAHLCASLDADIASRSESWFVDVNQQLLFLTQHDALTHRLTPLLTRLEADVARWQMERASGSPDADNVDHVLGSLDGEGNSDVPSVAHPATTPTTTTTWQDHGVGREYVLQPQTAEQAATRFRALQAVTSFLPCCHIASSSEPGVPQRTDVFNSPMTVNRRLALLRSAKKRSQSQAWHALNEDFTGDRARELPSWRQRVQQLKRYESQGSWSPSNLERHAHAKPVLLKAKEIVERLHITTKLHNAVTVTPVIRFDRPICVCLGSSLLQAINDSLQVLMEELPSVDSLFDTLQRDMASRSLDEVCALQSTLRAQLWVKQVGVTLLDSTAQRAMIEASVSGLSAFVSQESAWELTTSSQAALMRWRSMDNVWSQSSAVGRATFVPEQAATAAAGFEDPTMGLTKVVRSVTAKVRLDNVSLRLDESPAVSSVPTSPFLSRKSSASPMRTPPALSFRSKAWTITVAMRRDLIGQSARAAEAVFSDSDAASQEGDGEEDFTTSASEANVGEPIGTTEYKQRIHARLVLGPVECMTTPALVPSATDVLMAWFFPVTTLLDLVDELPLKRRNQVQLLVAAVVRRILAAVSDRKNDLHDPSLPAYHVHPIFGPLLDVHAGCRAHASRASWSVVARLRYYYTKVLKRKGDVRSQLRRADYLVDPAQYYKQLRGAVLQRGILVPRPQANPVQSRKPRRWRRGAQQPDPKAHVSLFRDSHPNLTEDLTVFVHDQCLADVFGASIGSEGAKYGRKASVADVQRQPGALKDMTTDLEVQVCLAGVVISMAAPATAPLSEGREDVVSGASIGVNSHSESSSASSSSSSCGDDGPAPSVLKVAPVQVAAKVTYQLVSVKRSSKYTERQRMRSLVNLNANVSVGAVQAELYHSLLSLIPTIFETQMRWAMHMELQHTKDVLSGRRLRMSHERGAHSSPPLELSVNAASVSVNSANVALISPSGRFVAAVEGVVGVVSKFPEQAFQPQQPSSKATKKGDKSRTNPLRYANVKDAYFKSSTWKQRSEWRPAKLVLSSSSALRGSAVSGTDEGTKEDASLKAVLHSSALLRVERIQFGVQVHVTSSEESLVDFGWKSIAVHHVRHRRLHSPNPAAAASDDPSHLMDQRDVVVHANEGDVPFDLVHADALQDVAVEWMDAVKQAKRRIKGDGGIDDGGVIKDVALEKFSQDRQDERDQSKQSVLVQYHGRKILVKRETVLAVHAFTEQVSVRNDALEEVGFTYHLKSPHLFVEVRNGRSMARLDVRSHQVHISDVHSGSPSPHASVPSPEVQSSIELPSFCAEAELGPVSLEQLEAEAEVRDWSTRSKAFPGTHRGMSSSAAEVESSDDDDASSSGSPAASGSRHGAQGKARGGRGVQARVTRETCGRVRLTVGPLHTVVSLDLVQRSLGVVARLNRQIGRVMTRFLDFAESGMETQGSPGRAPSGVPLQSVSEDSLFGGTDTRDATAPSAEASAPMRWTVALCMRSVYLKLIGPTTCLFAELDGTTVLAGNHLGEARLRTRAAEAHCRGLPTPAPAPLTALRLSDLERRFHVSVAVTELNLRLEDLPQPGRAAKPQVWAALVTHVLIRSWDAAAPGSSAPTRHMNGLKRARWTSAMGNEIRVMDLLESLWVHVDKTAIIWQPLSVYKVTAMLDAYQRAYEQHQVAGELRDELRRQKRGRRDRVAHASPVPPVPSAASSPGTAGVGHNTSWLRPKGSHDPTPEPSREGSHEGADPDEAEVAASVAITVCLSDFGLYVPFVGTMADLRQHVEQVSKQSAAGDPPPSRGSASEKDLRGVRRSMSAVQLYWKEWKLVGVVRPVLSVGQNVVGSSIVSELKVQLWDHYNVHRVLRMVQLNPSDVASSTTHTHRTAASVTADDTDSQHASSRPRTQGNLGCVNEATPDPFPPDAAATASTAAAPTPSRGTSRALIRHGVAEVYFVWSRKGMTKGSVKLESTGVELDVSSKVWRQVAFLQRSLLLTKVYRRRRPTDAKSRGSGSESGPASTASSPPRSACSDADPADQASSFLSRALSRANLDLALHAASGSCTLWSRRGQALDSFSFPKLAIVLKREAVAAAPRGSDLKVAASTVSLLSRSAASRSQGRLRRDTEAKTFLMVQLESAHITVTPLALDFMQQVVQDYRMFNGVLQASHNMESTGASSEDGSAAVGTEDVVSFADDSDAVSTDCTEPNAHPGSDLEDDFVDDQGVDDVDTCAPQDDVMWKDLRPDGPLGSVTVILKVKGITLELVCTHNAEIVCQAELGEMNVFASSHMARDPVEASSAPSASGAAATVYAPSYMNATVCLTRAVVKVFNKWVADDQVGLELLGIVANLSQKEQRVSDGYHVHVTVMGMLREVVVSFSMSSLRHYFVFTRQWLKPIAALLKPVEVSPSRPRASSEAVDVWSHDVSSEPFGRDVGGAALEGDTGTESRPVVDEVVVHEDEEEDGVAAASAEGASIEAQATEGQRPSRVVISVSTMIRVLEVHAKAHLGVVGVAYLTLGSLGMRLGMPMTLNSLRRMPAQAAAEAAAQAQRVSFAELWTSQPLEVESKGKLDGKVTLGRVRVWGERSHNAVVLNRWTVAFGGVDADVHYDDSRVLRLQAGAMRAELNDGADGKLHAELVCEPVRAQLSSESMRSVVSIGSRLRQHVVSSQLKARAADEDHGIDPRRMHLAGGSSATGTPRSRPSSWRRGSGSRVGEDDSGPGRHRASTASTPPLLVLQPPPLAAGAGESPPSPAPMTAVGTVVIRGESVSVALFTYTLADAEWAEYTLQNVVVSMVQSTDMIDGETGDELPPDAEPTSGAEPGIVRELMVRMGKHELCKRVLQKGAVSRKDAWLRPSAALDIIQMPTSAFLMRTNEITSQRRIYYWFASKFEEAIRVTLQLARYAHLRQLASTMSSTLDEAKGRAKGSTSTTKTTPDARAGPRKYHMRGFHLAPQLNVLEDLTPTVLTKVMQWMGIDEPSTFIPKMLHESLTDGLEGLLTALTKFSHQLDVIHGTPMRSRQLQWLNTSVVGDDSFAAVVDADEGEPHGSDSVSDA